MLEDRGLGTPWDAPELDPALRPLMRRLVEVLDANRERNRSLEAYYAGDVPLKNLGIAVPEDNAFFVLSKVRVDCDWAAIAVDRLADRSMLDGFVCASAELGDELAAIAPRVTRLYRSNLPIALVHGCSFWTVGRGAPGMPPVVVHAHSATSASAIWDETRDEVLAGMAIVGKGWNRGYTRCAPNKVDLHTRDAVVEFTRPDVDRDEWHCVALPHPAGRPLMEPLCYRADTRWRFGHSRISRQVRKICDSMMRENLRVEVASELNVLPQKYAFGLTPEQYDALDSDRFRNAVGALMMAASDEEDARKVTVGQFPQVSLQPHIDIKRDLAADFSGVTGVPMSELGVTHDNPSSAEAIEAAEKPLVTLCEHMNADMAQSLGNVARLMLAVRRDCAVDALPEGARSVAARFKDPAMPSLSASTDRAIKIVSAAPEYVQTEEFWVDVGKDADARRSIMGDFRRRQAREGATAVLDRNRGSGDGAERPGGGEVPR